MGNEGDACFILDGVLGELGALDIHIHGVAVSRSLDFLAIQQRRRAHVAGSAEVPPGTARHFKGAIATPGDRILQRSGKIDVARLVVRRIGIGDVAGEHLLSIRPQAQGLMLERQGIVEFADHVEHSGCEILQRYERKPCHSQICPYSLWFRTKKRRWRQ